MLAIPAFGCLSNAMKENPFDASATYDNHRVDSKSHRCESDEPEWEI
jgi:hypothetical protein